MNRICPNLIYFFIRQNVNEISVNKYGEWPVIIEVEESPFHFLSLSQKSQREGKFCFLNLVFIS